MSYKIITQINSSGDGVTSLYEVSDPPPVSSVVVLSKGLSSLCVLSINELLRLQPASIYNDPERAPYVSVPIEFSLAGSAKFTMSRVVGLSAGGKF